ncbi:Hsp20/alpha crystallin family protein [Patescibacteria group bacterium]|nr:Hsp20/alpha crystallin family protein [Patescibacteria group bacterium]
MAWSKILGLKNNFLEKKGEEVNVIYVEKNSVSKKISKQKKQSSSKKLKKETSKQGIRPQLAIDLYDDRQNNQLIIKVILAGIGAKQVDINVEPEMIMINYERARTEDEYRKYFYKELPCGKISRTIILPHQIRPAKARANLKNGILTIVLLKTSKEKDKIEVE